MSALLRCPNDHTWWAPFTDGTARRADGMSSCPRCQTLVAVPPPATVTATSAPAPLEQAKAEDRMAEATVSVAIGGKPVQVTFTVPYRPVRTGELLPAFRAFAGKIIELAVIDVEARGEKVSCQAGCGACCRQLVPITESEARQIRDLVQAMPEPRRSEVLARFATARRLLDEAGLLNKLLHPEYFPNEELRPVGLDYFHRGIPCPFLDDESCSIHPDRPISCREYLVTSPAANCAQPSAESVRVVPLSGKVSSAVQRLGLAADARFVKWVPLAVALEWANTHPNEEPIHDGPDLLREFFQRLGEKKKDTTVSEPDASAK